jgi:hypothetical protein
MIRVVAASGVYSTVNEHLERAEEVGFFLADWQREERQFVLVEWRPIGPEGYHLQTDHHVSLGDETRASVIKWAWDAGLSLVEVHSHGRWAPAGFSGSDLHGFREWVPHLWWRLQARPYAALVTAAGSFDGWAWVEAADCPEQIVSLEVDGHLHEATQQTFADIDRERRLEERRSA